MTTDAPHVPTEQLSALLDQQLPLAEQQQAEQHLAVCPRCEEELESLRTTVGLLRGLSQVESPRVFSLPATTLRAVPRSPLALRLVPWTRAAGALAAALFVVLLSVDLLAGAGRGQPVLAPASEPRPALAPAAESRGATSQPAMTAQPAEAARAAAPTAPSAAGAAFQAKPAQDKAATDSATSDTAARPAAPAGGASPAAVPAQPAAARAAAPLPAAPPLPAATPGLASSAGPTLTSPPAAEPPTTASGRVSPLRGWQIASGVLTVTLVLIALLLPRLAYRSR